MKKKINKIIDSRHLKIISAKKEQLKDAIVFITIDDEKFGLVDINYLRQIGEMIEKQEPTGFYFPCSKKLDIEIYDKAQLKNKNLLVKVGESDIDYEFKKQIEENFLIALSEAKNVEFVYGNAKIEEKK